jgi:hypothetical protein
MGRGRKGKRKDRPMRPKRLADVERIERRGKKVPTTIQHVPPAGPPAPRDARAAARIAEARKLGLSVSAESSADQVDSLLEQFALASRYAGDVWHALTGNRPEDQGVPREEWDRFVAWLFDDGRLAERVVTVQRAREQAPPAPLKHGWEYCRVARLLRGQFAARLPKRSLLARVLGRG